MIELLQGLLTPVIAVVATFIAYQQYRLRRDERERDMYDRRLEVYKKVVSIIYNVRASEPMTTKDALDWRHSLSEADFLFSKEVSKLIDELYKSVLDWVALTETEKITGKRREIRVDEWNLERAQVVDDFENFEYPISQIFSAYLHPGRAPFWKRKRKSLNQLRKMLKKQNLDEESRRRVSDERDRAIDIDPNQDIQF